MEKDSLTQTVISSAIEVHKALGPGLLESSYEHCLMYELSKAGLDVKRQITLPIVYKGVRIDAGYRLDLLIPNKLIIEIKSVDRFAPIHTAQVISYLRLSNIKTGLLINFSVDRLVKGIKRVSL
ncbi:GxxExxY protein [Oleiphilus sp. HI0061]|uniref:GxxExxY protein n=1 Tax=Oleiphilus sp. HI0061 TaxID=1822239 RepID=UPI0007CFDD31|nr:GxxExxY protein [Oleiphilus sp. HI0061]KZY60807.1 GxxExxY protein [Oleiphilus sp. HI0061]KZY61224.1 GxxExxY protein [Oleiphilus sp. HI0061]